MQWSTDKRFYNAQFLKFCQLFGHVTLMQEKPSFCQRKKKKEKEKDEKRETVENPVFPS